MSRFEQLREEVTRVMKGIAENEAMEKSTRKIDEQEEEEDVKRRRTEAREGRSRIKLNWPIVKQETIEIFHQINKEVFENKGRISNWRKRCFRHIHTIADSWDGADSGSYSHDMVYQGIVETAELTVGKMGKISAVRLSVLLPRWVDLVDNRDMSSDWVREFQTYHPTDWIHFIYSTNTRVSCPECGGGGFPLNISTLDIRKEVESCIVDKVKTLVNDIAPSSIKMIE